VRRALALAALLLFLLPSASARAATPKVDLVDVEDEVMCVDCGIPLNTAEGAQPDSQRALIRDLITQGRTKEQIKQELVAEYGKDVLALPETSGVGLTAYAVPLVLGGLVIGALVLLVPRWRRRRRQRRRRRPPRRGSRPLRRLTRGRLTQRVGRRLARAVGGLTAELLDVRDAGDRLVAIIHTHAPPEWEHSPDPHGEVVTVRDGRIVEMVIYPTVDDALAAARAASRACGDDR